MNAAAAEYPGDHGRPTEVIPSHVLTRLSEGERVVVRCQLADLPGTEANAVITRVSGRLETMVYATETPGMTMPATPSSHTVIRHSPEHALATDCRTDPATAERWLATIRTGTATPWTNSPDDFAHLKNWILALAPNGLFTATTRSGVAVGVGGHAVQGADVEVAMISGADLIAYPRCSTSVTRLHGLIARWRRAGAPYTEQLPAALVRHGECWRVRLVVPRTEPEL